MALHVLLLLLLLSLLLLLVRQCRINISFAVYDTVAVTDLSYTVPSSDPVVNPKSNCILHIRFC